jgi:hypothetical protein
MDKQERVNALGKHFENFNERMQTDQMFAQCMMMLIEEHCDVYGLIDVLIGQQNELLSQLQVYNG